MSRPGTGRRIDCRRSQIYERGLPIAPFASRLIHANYADRGIAIATGVSGWEDVVGNRDFVQADTTKQPAYGLFTTRPALVFDGVNDFMQSPVVTLSTYPTVAFALSFLFTGATLKIIYETSATGGNAGTFSIFENNATTLLLNFKNTVSNEQKQVTGVTAGNVYRLIVVVNASAAAQTYSRVYLNNVSQAPAGTSDRGFLDAAHYIGARGGTSLFWPGKLGDTLAYAGDLSVAEIGVVDAFLASRCV